MLDRDFSYDWDEIRDGGVIMSRRLTSTGAVVEERYLSGDDATQFRREYNAAANKEKSRIFKKHV
ncbi:hypothetical protein AGMMS49579_26940 [Spirochaetia bacterium]|nr:hypothetical protein AGMMS49579_26940 [Spirochaetia bacterium]